MNTYELMEKLRHMPVFTVNDLAKITGLKAASVRMLVWRLAKKGLITRIERSKYTAITEPLVVASYLVHPSYIGLYSALRFHDMTTQILGAIDIMVSKSRKNTVYGNRKIIFSKTKHFWGFEKQKIGEYEVLVSDPEKTILDCLLSGKVRISQVIESLKSHRVNEKRLLSYVLKVEDASLAKRMGFLLDKAGYEVSEYRKYAVPPYIKLDKKMPRKGRKNRDWRIIENTVI